MTQIFQSQLSIWNISVGVYLMYYDHDHGDFIFLNPSVYMCQVLLTAAIDVFVWKTFFLVVL